jgi:hypothetical protein
MANEKIDDTLRGQNIDPDELAEDDRMELRRDISEEDESP